MEEGHKYHIDGTEKFGYITINRFLYSFYMYMNTVKRITCLYRYASVNSLKGFDLLSYISQYVHGLSMSNLVIELDEQNINGVVGEALGLIKRLHKYTMAFYPEEQRYILEELLEPDMRDKTLACYDEAHRPDVATWNNGVMNKMQQLSYTGSYEIIF